jgi:hypothetical protein
VIVLDGGRIVEDGSPGELRANPNSRYASLARADEQARSELWGAAHWLRRSLREGRLKELPS